MIRALQRATTIKFDGRESAQKLSPTAKRKETGGAALSKNGSGSVSSYGSEHDHFGSVKGASVEPVSSPSSGSSDGTLSEVATMTEKQKRSHTTARSFSVRIRQAEKNTSFVRKHSFSPTDEENGEEGFTLNKLNLAEVQLFERESEIAKLREIFLNRSSCSGPVVVSISGFAGTGKAELAQTLLPTVQQNGGFLVTGRFPEVANQPQSPFAPLSTVISDLIGQVIGRTDLDGFTEELTCGVKEAIGIEGAKVVGRFVSNLGTLMAGEVEKEKAPLEATPDQVKAWFWGLVLTVFKQTAQPGRPVVIVLEEVPHSSDEDSLFIGCLGLLADIGCQDLFLVTTRRLLEDKDNLGKDSHAEKLEELHEQSAVVVHHIATSNLCEASVSKLVATALRSDEQDIKQLDSTHGQPNIPALAHVIFQRTLGNPSAVVKFLTSLVDDGLLEYNYVTLHWHWDLDKIRESTTVADNVAASLEFKVSRLSNSIQLAVLQVASCLGVQFHPETLVHLLDDESSGSSKVLGLLVTPKELEQQSTSQFLDVLEQSIKDGILERRQRGAMCCFVHDRIREAAFDRIAEDVRMRLQLRIGQKIIGRVQPVLTGGKLRPEDPRAAVVFEDLFVAVNLCNAGSPLLLDRMGLVRYNWLAGEKALEKRDFVGALRFMEMGLNCLESEPEASLLLSADVHFQMECGLRVGAARAACACGKLQKVPEHLLPVLQNQSLLATLSLYRTVQSVYVPYLVYLASTDQDSGGETVVEMGRRLLNELLLPAATEGDGQLADFLVSLSLPAADMSNAVLDSYRQTKHLLEKHSFESLINLPVLWERSEDDVVEDESAEHDHNRRIWLAMSVIDVISTTASMTSPSLHILMILQSVRWSLRFGVCRFSPCALAAFGVVAHRIKLVDSRVTAFFGDVAMALSEKLKTEHTTLAKTMLCVFGFLHGLTNDLRSIAEPLHHGYKLGLRAGDTETAMALANQCDLVLFCSASRPLDMLAEQIKKHDVLTKESDHTMHRFTSAWLLHTVLKLRGEHEDEVVKIRSEMNVGGLLSDLKSFLLASAQMQVAYLFGDHVDASEQEELCRSYGESNGSFLFMNYMPRHLFFRGLVLVEVAKKKRKRKTLGPASAILKQLQKMADFDHGNVNCVHMVNLLEAEIAVAEDKDVSVVQELFERALNTAARHGYLQDRALAHERAGLFHLSLSSCRSQPNKRRASHNSTDFYWPTYHFENALKCYAEWGAAAKVTDILDRQGQMLNLTPATATYLAGATKRLSLT